MRPSLLIWRMTSASSIMRSYCGSVTFLRVHHQRGRHSEACTQEACRSVGQGVRCAHSLQHHVLRLSHPLAGASGVATVRPAHRWPAEVQVALRTLAACKARGVFHADWE